MSVIDGAANAVAKPFGWAKAAPWVFLGMLIVFFVLAVRFREALVRLATSIAKWPLVGRPVAVLTGINGKGDAPPAAAP